MIKHFLFSLIFVLTFTSCNFFDGSTGEVDDKFFTSNHPDNPNNSDSYPDAPTSIALNNSNNTNGSVDQTPSFIVNGVQSGDTVRIYSDATCSGNTVAQVSAQSTSATLEINSSNKLTATNTYTFYASTERNGFTSSCSTFSVDYDYYACPSNYIPIPANPLYGNEDFCVAKYEMKSGPISSPSGVPEVSLNRAAAITNCSGIASEYSLIKNIEWQTIARNIELVSSNWDGGVVGTNDINNGQHYGGPVICDATHENLGTSPVCGSSDNANRATKRTHDLSNGEVIWDFAGNVSEWILDNKAGSDFAASTGINRISLVTAAAPGTSLSLSGDGFSRNFKEQFGPSGDYSTSHSGIPYGGLGGMSSITSTNTAIYRGGKSGDGVQSSGIFHITVATSGSSFTTLGYRCVYTK